MCFDCAIIAVGLKPQNIFQKLTFGKGHVWIEEELEQQFKFFFGSSSCSGPRLTV